MAVRIGADFLSTGRLTGLLLLASEALVVVLTVFRRTPAVVDRSAKARVLTALSLIGPLLVPSGEVAPFAAEALTVSASAVGLMVVIAGKVALGRSFGLIPANRGVVCTGPYRLVRHPIYLGYLITHVAFVAANPTMWNMVVFTIADVALLARAVCEEETLDTGRGLQGVYDTRPVARRAGRILKRPAFPIGSSPRQSQDSAAANLIELTRRSSRRKYHIAAILPSAIVEAKTSTVD